MDALALNGNDIYCECGCGGGVLLKMALAKAGQGAAIDHSQSMVELAVRTNQAHVDRGRVEITLGDAESLPWASERFTACGCANMFFFLENPEACLSEIARVLAPGGRFSMVTVSNGLLARITCGWSCRMNSHSDSVMTAMMRAAGFKKVRVHSPSMGLIQICYGEK